MASTTPKLDTDLEVEDSDTNFSVAALVGALASVGGLVSIFRLQAVPFAMIGIGLGAFALLNQRRWNIGVGSQRLAFFAVAAGLFGISWGVIQSRLEQERLLTRAKSVAKEFLDLLANNQLEQAVRLSKSQADALGVKIDEAVMANTVRLSRDHVDTFTKNVGISDVIKRGKKAKWEFVGVKASGTNMRGLGYTLLYKDASVPNSKNLMVRMIREPPVADRPTMYMWFVPECEWE